MEIDDFVKKVSNARSAAQGLPLSLIPLLAIILVAAAVCHVVAIASLAGSGARCHCWMRWSKGISIGNVPIERGLNVNSYRVPSIGEEKRVKLVSLSSQAPAGARTNLRHDCDFDVGQMETASLDLKASADAQDRALDAHSVLPVVMEWTKCFEPVHCEHPTWRDELEL